MLAAERLHVDDTTVTGVGAKMQDPHRAGSGPTCATTGRSAVQARRRRLFYYSPTRKGEHPRAHLKDFRGVMQADAVWLQRFNERFASNRITEAACRVGGDVAIPAPHRPGRADYPHPVLRAQGSLRRRCTDGRSRLAARDTARAWL